MTKRTPGPWFVDKNDRRTAGYRIRTIYLKKRNGDAFRRTLADVGLTVEVRDE